MSHIVAPFKMHKHPELLHKINGLSIGIKLHYTLKPEGEGGEEKLRIAKGNHPAPTWEDVLEVLKESYDVINEIKEDPRKY